MTEAEWLECREPESLIWFVRDRRGMVRTKAGRRKLRLFACACCRLVWELILDEPCRRAVEVTEAIADGTAGKEEHAVARAAATTAAQGRWQTGWDAARLAPAHQTTILWRAARAAELAADQQPGLAAGTAGPIIAKDVSPLGHEGEKARHIGVIRDIFGNPFRPVVFSSSWRTDTAVTLARQMYESREFGAMPILADALQDAGCDNTDILDHCRDATATHVRGCWVVDLVLGKE